MVRRYGRLLVALYVVSDKKQVHRKRIFVLLIQKNPGDDSELYPAKFVDALDHPVFFRRRRF